MSAPAFAGRPSLTIRGTRYPVLLPTVRDPRLHLAAVIVTLQVLGQTAFGFNLSIAQILVALGTCAVLEVGIAFFRHHLILWPASALLTGNGVAFILRVPGTEHGDWWSPHGAWIFAGTAAIALLSKHLIRVHGRHVFNPSNFGLVVCFLALGKFRADPLDFWWGPMSPWMALALCVIVVGGFAILTRLRLLAIAVGFWLTFAAGMALLAVSGHSMTARWHVGPITGWDFWWLLVTSPEILIFLFFMITDPKTIPDGRRGRLAYAVGVGLLATLLIAPQTTEFATKVAVLTALALVCAARGAVELVGARRLSALTRRRPRRLVVGTAALAGALAYAGLVVAAGIPARPEPGLTSATAVQGLPAITVVDLGGVSGIDDSSAQTIARDVVVALRAESDALRTGNLERATDGASGVWLASLWQRIRDSAGRPVVVATYELERMALRLHRGAYQGPPTVVARIEGTMVVSTYAQGTAQLVSRHEPASFRRTLELALEDGRYVVVSSTGGGLPAPAPAPAATGPTALGDISLENVADQVGLRFTQGAFRFGVSNDVTAMMGGGLCWLDYDNDGRLDLFVVNSHADVDIVPSEAKGGLPRTALYQNVGGRFVDVSARSGADLPVRGDGCVAADLNLDGHTDLYVTSAGYNVATDSWDALLWNNGDGTFTEGAVQAGINANGWHSAAVVGDVNGDGRPDLFVSSYTDPNFVVDTASGFPSDHAPVRDLLYLNEGTHANGHSTFREVARPAGIERTRVGHGLGAIFTDFNHDGRLDLYVANDADPNQLYENVALRGRADADPEHLGFRFEDVAKREDVADPNAGMGIAAQDFTGDGRTDIFVTNSRDQLHAAYRSLRAAKGPSFADARPELAAAVGSHPAGWGVSWADLDLDGDLDLVLANGAIPVVNLAKDARRVQILENVSGPGKQPRFASVKAPWLARTPAVNGRGLATADFDNDGDLDIAVNSIGGRLILLRNDSPKRHWLEVRLRTFAPGAVLTATLGDGRKLVREVQAGSSYLSSEDPRVHFGLGKAATVAQLAIRFPGGMTTSLENVAADRIVDVG
jgi:Na+-translocating ferredoxin:NAD+ oxidoreductase RnfD subunit